MPSQADLVQQFHALHQPGSPVVLFNIWDPGSAQAVAAAGAKALATGSWPVAAAHGYLDGEQIPLELVLDNLKRIVAAVDLPVTGDLEGGYGAPPQAVYDTVSRACATGIVGFNFEDQVVGTATLHDIDSQRERVEAARKAADDAGQGAFLNARTDIFLKAKPEDHSPAMLEEALTRAKAYAEAGANGFFAPGLADEGLIARLCEEQPLPVNIIALPHVPDGKTLAGLGVARISYGPVPYKRMAAWLTEQAKAALAGA